ncbi:peptidoglycan DD-metalloendopeptidase family protein [Maricaulis sp. CAU 1757]
MSGFDVSRADTHRTRGLVAFASLTLSTALLAALLMSGEPQSDASPFSASAEATETTGRSSALVGTDDPLTGSGLTSRSRGATILDTQEQARLYHAAFNECASCPEVIQIEREVPRGGTLAGLLDDAGIDRVEAAKAVSALNTIYDLRYLRAGERVKFYFETSSGLARPQDVLRLTGLSFRPDVDRSITVSRTWDDEFRARETIAEFDREIVRSAGSINTSLYVDALNVGATDRVVVELANVLAYAVDFQRSIQPGDQFDIVFERFVDGDGTTARTGDILYASYTSRSGEPKQFFRYETDDGGVGYYNEDGESAERLLMLTPINGARLSSHFGRRRHPILGYTRAHNGTDFAAPTGTPIFAAGNGVVQRANRFGSFGNYVRIRHPNGFETAYAHLNGFARGITAGTRVRQGQVIAYVGTTGRSTGPHLHYEVHQNGRPVNPMNLDLPTGRQLEEDELDDFFAERDRIIEIRESAPAADDSQRTLLAEAGSGAQ